jgi:PTH1 family peptidyl-tRNA hydrolase
MSIFNWFKPKRDKVQKEGKDVAVKIIVGLGNPGPRYEMTRHNVGFRVVHALGTSYGGEFKTEKKFQAEICKVPIEGQDVVLVKPLTMMNLSGHAFIAVKNWYKVPLESFLVVHDDVSIALGRLRLQRQGGAGGQHGVESIIEQLGGEKGFDRLKFGVGPDPGGALRADYVLGTFPVAQEDLLENSLDIAGRAVKIWLKEGIQGAMNAFNGINLAS